jgi:hypothetical protein
VPHVACDRYHCFSVDCKGYLDLWVLFSPLEDEKSGAAYLLDLRPASFLHPPIVLTSLISVFFTSWCVAHFLDDGNIIRGILLAFDVSSDGPRWMQTSNNKNETLLFYLSTSSHCRQKDRLAREPL